MSNFIAIWLYSFPFGGRYQHGEFSIIPAGAERCQTLAFRAMVDRFFADGAVDEINIRYFPSTKYNRVVVSWLFDLVEHRGP